MNDAVGLAKGALNHNLDILDLRGPQNLTQEIYSSQEVFTPISEVARFVWRFESMDTTILNLKVVVASLMHCGMQNRCSSFCLCIHPPEHCSMPGFCTETLQP
jgi:hypothetical protein